MMGDHTPKLKPTFRNSRTNRLSCGNTNAYKNPLIQDSSPCISSIVSPSYASQAKRPCHRNRLSASNSSFKSPLLNSSFSSSSSQHTNTCTPNGLSTNENNERNINSSMSSSNLISPKEDTYQVPKANFNSAVQEDINSFDSNSLIEMSNNLQLEVQKLDKEIDVLKQQDYKVEDLKWYIDKFHEYNEVKDVAQMVMGRIAEIEGSTVKAVHEEFGLNEDDCC